MASWLWFVLVALLVAGLGWSLRPVRTVGPATPSQAWITAERHARRVTVAAWTALIPLPVLLAAGHARHAERAVARDARRGAPGRRRDRLPRRARRRRADVATTGRSRAARGAGPASHPRRRAARPVVVDRSACSSRSACCWACVRWRPAPTAGACPTAAPTGWSRRRARSRASTTAGPSPLRTLLLGLGCVGVLLLVARRAAVSDTSPPTT